MKRNPIAGPHRQNLQTPDENWVVQMAKDCQWTTSTCLEAAALAGRLQSEGGVPYSIYRAWGFEPNPGNRTGDDLKKYAREVYGQIRNMVAQTGNQNTHINVNCEQGHSPNRIRMYTELMRLNTADPHGLVGMVFLNTFIGTIQIGFWGQPNEFESDYFMEFLTVFDQTRTLRLASGSYAHILGVHNYTSQFAWIAVNGGEERSKPINWNTANNIKIDWNKAQDHLGREYQGIRRALKYTWDNNTRVWAATSETPRRDDGSPVEPPWIIWTESLFDAVNGVPIFAHPIDHNSTPRGYHSMKTWWENTAFPEDKGHGHTLAKMGKWVWANLCDDGYTIGWNGYTLGDTGSWESHNTGRKDGTDGAADPDTDYWNDMKAYRVEMPDHFFKAVTAPPIPVPPIPTDPPKPPNAAQPQLVLIEGSFKLRTAPDTSAPQVGTLTQGEQVTMYRQPETAADSNVWHFVERHNTPGIEATQGYTAYPMPPTSPQPPLSVSTSMRVNIEVPSGTDITALQNWLSKIRKMTFVPLSDDEESQ